MAYEPKPNSGALFRNDRKESENHPDYKGDAVIGDVSYWLSAWINESKAGQKYMSIRFEPKEPRQPAAPSRQERAPAPPPAPEEDDGNDDEIPF